MGVDPGLVATGFAVLEAAPGAVTVLDAGVITTVATQSLEARLNAIHRAVLDIIESRRPAFLVVEDLYGSHEIKLPAGDLVLYPASSLHLVTPVTRGMRVASFFWLQSMVRDAHARSLIFDLDTSIQALVERLGRDDPETVKLTGIYHNLIRYWAEV